MRGDEEGETASARDRTPPVQRNESNRQMFELGCRGNILATYGRYRVTGYSYEASVEAARVGLEHNKNFKEGWLTRLSESDRTQIRSDLYPDTSTAMVREIVDSAPRARCPPQVERNLLDVAPRFAARSSDGLFFGESGRLAFAIAYKHYRSSGFPLFEETLYDRIEAIVRRPM